jgi:hypothetical protein
VPLRLHTHIRTSSHIRVSSGEVCTRCLVFTSQLRVSWRTTLGEPGTLLSPRVTCTADANSTLSYSPSAAYTLYVYIQSHPGLFLVCLSQVALSPLTSQLRVSWRTTLGEPGTLLSPRVTCTADANSTLRPVELLLEGGLPQELVQGQVGGNGPVVIGGCRYLPGFVGPGRQEGSWWGLDGSPHQHHHYHGHHHRHRPHLPHTAMTGG